MIEIVIADQTAVWLTAGRTVFIFVNTFENRTLIPSDTFVFFARFPDLLLTRVHTPYLQHFIRLGVTHQMVEPAPSPFQLPELIVMNDQVNLFGKVTFQFTCQRLDGEKDVV